jgi:DHA2 family multidrug resistance protein
MTTVLPLFYQTLMGYDATNAGLAVAPRGLGSVFRAVLVGLISSKVDPRKLVALGFAIFGGAALWTGSLTLEISPTSLFWPITVNGLAISLVFVPLSNVALGTMPQEQIGNASGIYNLIRNIGGSIGISAANTIAQRHLQTHRNDLVHWLSGSSWLVQKQMRMLMMSMQHHAGPHRAMLLALFLTQRGLNNQAQLWTFSATWLSCVRFVCRLLFF